MNNDNFLIEISDLELAQTICASITNEKIRNRAVSNVLSAKIAGKYFSEVEADIESGLHTIPYILNKVDIADIYVRGTYIDVRVYFEDKELYVPKIHFDTGLLPVAYMFIKVDQGLSGGLVTGFIQPSAIDLTSSNGAYYVVKEEDLVSYYDIEPLLVTDYDIDYPDNFESLIFDYLDQRLSKEDLKQFFQTLLKVTDCRLKLKDAANVDSIFKAISSKGTINKSENATIDVLSAPETEILSDNLSINPELDDISPIEETETVLDIELAEESSDLDFGLELEENSQNEIINLEEDSEVAFVGLEEESSNNEDFGFKEDDESSTFLLDSDEDEFDGISMDENSESEKIELEAEIESGINLTDSEDTTQITVENTEEDFEIRMLPAGEENISNLADSPIKEISEINKNDNTIDQDDVIETETETLEPIQIDEQMENADENLNALLFDNEENSFTTVTTPSIQTIEEGIIINSDEESDEDIPAEELDFVDEPSEQNEEIIANEVYDNENSEQIEELFGEQGEEDTFVEIPNNTKKASPLPVIGIFAIIIAVAGYFGYTKYINNDTASNESSEAIQTVLPKENITKPVEAMPIETVENIKTPQRTDEGDAVSIPAIEENLDASITVSNLSINWEVPASYASNNSAKRYFTKMGKIIQLNLKSELLLLSKTPVSNKIVVELQFNKNNNKFEVKGITTSSGEKVIDDAIAQTIKNALNLNLKTNISAFGKTQGNPSLIIRL